MSEHTPGPWSYTMDKERGWDFKVTDDHGKTAIVSGCGCCDSPWVSCEADARLIAAAPEMLEALENLLKVHEGEGGTQHNAADMAQAAIAKAKGEE